MILTQIEVIHNVTVDVTPQYRWLGASFLLATVYSVRPAAGVISLCRVVCRQNRGFGSILDTGITCLSWSSPQHGATPNPPPPHTWPHHSIQSVAGVISLCWTVPESAFSHYSGHLVPSLWDLHMFYLLRPILFSELVISPDYALRISLGTFSILLIFITNYLNKIKRNFEKNEACVWMICSGLISLNK